MIEQNFIRLLHSGFEKYWEEPMYTNFQEEGTLKFKDTAREIAKLHQLFEGTGIKVGDKISLLGRNNKGWAISYLATITYGAVIVPILPDFNPEDAQHIVNHSDSVVLFCGETLWPALEMGKMPKVKYAVSLQSFERLDNRRTKFVSQVELETIFNSKYPNGITPENLNFANVDNKELMVLNYTSGTTGFSKGVMIPANSLAGNITFAMENIPMDPKSKLVSFLPLAHTYGCAFDFLLGVVMGVHVTFISKTPTPQILLPAFAQMKPQVIFIVPLIVEKIYKKKLLPVISKPTMKILLSVPVIKTIIYNKIRNSLIETFGGNLREMVIGGAALNPDAELFLKKIKFPFTIGYGMTECGPLISYKGWKETRNASAGKILPLMEHRIDSSDPFNEPGEILVRGENLMYGYYKFEEATKQTIDEEGWLHTGDVGVTDSEGYIYIKGRSKSMILGASGQNIYPEEIEAKLNNMNYVLESLILENSKKKLVALVVPDKDALKIHHKALDDLPGLLEENRKHLNKIVANYEQVSAIKIHYDEFEKTPKRSIKRFLYLDAVE